MHNAAFAADGADYAYLAMDVASERLAAAVEGLSALGFLGFNVTMPHKEAMLPLVDELDDAARLAGAVNTVVADEGGKLRGLNTDGSGFVEACAEASVSLSGRRVLILGAGGAASAVAVAVLGEGVSRLCLVNRTVEKAQRLRERLAGFAGGAEVVVRSPGEIDKAATEAEVLINATYLGMREEDPLPFPADCLKREKVVCDAVYSAGRETGLILHARENGAHTVSGDRMLLYQGVQAQRAWTGREPNVAVMSDALA